MVLPESGQAHPLFELVLAMIFESRGPYGTGRILKELLKLANEKLTKTYRWREGDAVWFVLTGHVPPVRPLEVRASINVAPNRPGKPQTLVRDSSPPRYMAPIPNPADYHPNTAQIIVTAFAWVNAKEVEQAFRDAQKQLLPESDAAGQMPERTLEVIRSVAHDMKEHSEEDWNARWRAWQRTAPEKWRYQSEVTFKQPFERFIRDYVRRIYELPNYRRPKPTPYQEYRDNWIKRRKGAG